MSEKIKNYGKSIRTKLLNVAKAENAFYQTVLTRYFQERLLFRLSASRYKDDFYLKGGALMYTYEHFAAHPFNTLRHSFQRLHPRLSTG